MDIFRLLVQYLAGFPGVAEVRVDLPTGVKMKSLPVVNLVSAGPAGRDPSFQGLGRDLVPIDVELYVSHAFYQSGKAWELASALRLALSRFEAGMARAVDVSRPEKQADRNPKIRRIGFTVEVSAPAIS